MTADPIFEPIPTAEIATPLPKRPGRAPALNPDGTRKHPPRPAGNRRGKTPRKPSASRPRTPKSLAPVIGAFLALINGAVIVSPLGTRPVVAITDPNVIPERIGDELDAVEIAALASAIDAQCRRSPRFRKYVESALSAGSGGTLITVIGLIAARRLARHGVLPANIDIMGGIVLSADLDSLASIMPAPATTDAETGETVPDRSADDANES
jgi:hypothetical protein